MMHAAFTISNTFINNNVLLHVLLSHAASVALTSMKNGIGKPPQHGNL
jgi:hypothetical protein